jgi:hypothetical protein
MELTWGATGLPVGGPTVQEIISWVRFRAVFRGGAFPGQIRSVTLGKPTLEDVFIKHTGHRFWKTPEE